MVTTRKWNICAYKYAIGALRILSLLIHLNNHLKFVSFKCRIHFKQPSELIRTKLLRCILHSITINSALIVE